MSAIVLDTDVASAILKDRVPDRLASRLSGTRPAITFVTVGEPWVAACCLARELPLATLNVKDFVDFRDHEGLELVT